MPYSTKINQRNSSADPSKLGVQLGRLCISISLPVNQVALELGVSRAIVYKWFTGKSDVGKHLRQKVEAYYSRLPRTVP